MSSRVGGRGANRVRENWQRSKASVVLAAGSNVRNSRLGTPLLSTPPTSPCNTHSKYLIPGDTTMLSFSTAKDSDNTTSFYKILLGGVVLVKITKC